MDAILYNKITTESDRIISTLRLDKGYFPVKYLTTVAMDSPIFDTPSNVDIDFDGAVFNAQSTKLIYGSNAVNLTIRNLTWSNIYIANAFQNNGSLETITFIDSTIAPKGTNYMFSNCTALRTINGELDFSYSSANPNAFQSCRSLEDVTFKVGSIIANLTFDAAAPLTDASLISIANGLSSEVSEKTLSLGNTNKTRCISLMGTVSDGVFTADENGSTTLSDFITTTKGWTLS